MTISMTTFDAQTDEDIEELEMTEIAVITGMCEPCREALEQGIAALVRNMVK
jgi:hypothetical protein